MAKVMRAICMVMQLNHFSRQVLGLEETYQIPS